MTLRGSLLDANDPVTGKLIGTKIADGTLTSSQFANSQIDTRTLAGGAVTAEKLVDGAATTAKLADGAVTTAKLAEGAVTPVKLLPRTATPDAPLGGLALSQSSGNWSTTNLNSFVTVPSLQGSLASSGRPVLLMLVPEALGNDLTSNDGSYVGVSRLTEGPVDGRIAIVRNGNHVVGQSRIRKGINATVSNDHVLRPSILSFIDLPPQGTWTYTIRVQMIDGKTLWVYKCKLVAFEL